ncbi:DUF4230 domain-containing protein [Methylomonas methanica]|uniref:Uncharacterized protein n=1 Tax=Methylomonas methanica (strain DSM 25384 / MC09) TaxID=857087 RepID=F9ZX50_METMM|nr:DUF4230 domain-containing protein [Methylomonas methanica]AEF99660.1 hypothetical protein Metme_1232 [Methylomonas methanica MC09]
MTIKISFGLLVFIVVIAVSLWVYLNSKQTQAIQGAIHGLGLQEKQALIVAELTTTEVFSKTEYNYLFKDFPFGDTTTSIKLTAHYQYYLKLSELSYELKGDTLVFKSPRLYPLLPVAFDIDTIAEDCQAHFLAPDCKESLQHLKSEISQQMPQLAKLRISMVYDKAAKSLADIFYNFLTYKSYPIGFSKIRVVIGEENSKSSRVYAYDPNCWLIECLAE